MPEEGANGVILSQGGAFGGLALYAKNGKLAYCYNLFGLERFKAYSEDPIPAGTRQVRMEFAYDGGGVGKGGDVSLFVDGEQVGEGRVDGTVPMLFSADETTDVGSDTATPVSDDYGPQDSIFTGTVHWVQIDLDEAAEDADHLVSPEERFRVVDGKAVGSRMGRSSTDVVKHSTDVPGPAPAEGMRWIPDGTFAMGSEGFYPEERPVHRVAVDGFWMDEHPVTAADFRRFVRETKYVTVAERPLDPDDYPDADPDCSSPARSSSGRPPAR